jgi:hypothetical protein
MPEVCLTSRVVWPSTKLQDSDDKVVYKYCSIPGDQSSLMTRTFVMIWNSEIELCPDKNNK